LIKASSAWVVAKFEMVFGETVILDTVTLNCCMIILLGVCFCLLKRLGLQPNLIESLDCKVQMGAVISFWIGQNNHEFEKDMGV